MITLSRRNRTKMSELPFDMLASLFYVLCILNIFETIAVIEKARAEDLRFDQ